MLDLPTMDALHCQLNCQVYCHKRFLRISDNSQANQPLIFPARVTPRKLLATLTQNDRTLTVRTRLIVAGLLTLNNWLIGSMDKLLVAAAAQPDLQNYY